MRPSPRTSQAVLLEAHFTGDSITLRQDIPRGSRREKKSILKEMFRITEMFALAPVFYSLTRDKVRTGYTQQPHVELDNEVREGF